MKEGLSSDYHFHSISSLLFASFAFDAAIVANFPFALFLKYKNTCVRSQCDLAVVGQIADLQPALLCWRPEVSDHNPKLVNVVLAWEERAVVEQFTKDASNSSEINTPCVVP